MNLYNNIKKGIKYYYRFLIYTLLLLIIHTYVWFKYFESSLFDTYEFIICNVTYSYLTFLVFTINNCLLKLKLKLKSNNNNYNNIIINKYKNIVIHSSIATVSLLFLIVNILFATAIVGGLSFWSRIASLDLIIAYLNQIDPLLKVLNAPDINIIYSIVSVILLILWTIFYQYFHWTPIQYIKETKTKLLYGLLAFILPTLCLMNHPYFFHKGLIKYFISGSLSTDIGAQGVYNTQLSSLNTLNQQSRVKYLNHLKHHKPILNPIIQKPILMIVIDAMRYDKTSMARTDRDTTPYLKSMIEQGLLINYKNNHPNIIDYDAIHMMRSVCGESLCGTTSLLSSASGNTITPKAFTVLEILQQYNYEPHVILSGNHTQFYGMSDIYAGHQTYMDGKKFNDTVNKKHYVNDDGYILEYLKQLSFNPKKTPLAYVHLMGVHNLGNRQEHFKRWNPSSTDFLMLKPSEQSTMRERQQILTTAYINNYDNGLLQTDEKIKHIIEVFKQKINHKDFLLLMTADHGELLGEHNKLSHGQTVYEPVLNIPLFYAGFSKPLIPQLSTQADIAPSLLYELNIPTPDNFKGKPLQINNPLQYTLHKQGFDTAVIRNDGLKLIFNTKQNTIQAYQLKQDPTESNNIIQTIDKATHSEFLQQLINEGIALD